ncbi:Uncharacterised protein [Legionella beliardensis]|uniref:DUF4434 domain-containing protein n=2 Tax=Legionella beliardensis TaxID=91822 RepID=A0A378I3A2_9GAMM|nr:Uncharacterised protein [Legionella beliardensis]
MSAEKILLAECPISQVNTSFLQLYNDQKDRPSAVWESLFKEAHNLGINHIIIQWSSYDESAFYPVINQPFNSLLFTVIKAAQKEHLTITMGLNYNRQFWQALSGSDAELNAYLEQHYQQQQTTMPYLMNLINTADPEGNTVAGWYIAEEIDDLNWQNDKRRNLLKNYLSQLTQLLKSQRPNWPISLSTYATGQVDPKQVAALYKFLFTNTTIDNFLFQDSIGTQNLTLSTLEDYLKIITAAHEGSDKQFAVIVELFIEDSKQNVFLSAPPDLVLPQLKIANKYSTTNPVVFSFFPYVLPSETMDNAALYNFWRQETQRCKSLWHFIFAKVKSLPFFINQD